MSDQPPPCGKWFARIAERTFDRETFARVIVPAIADLQHECSQSTRSLVRVRAWWAVARVSVVCLIGDVLHDRNRSLRGLAWRTALVLPVLATLLMLPVGHSIIWDGPTFGFATRAIVVALNAPPNFLLALPPAFFLALCLHRSARDSRSLHFVPSAVAGTFVCAAIVFAMIMAIVPTTNQMSRLHLANAFSRNAPEVHLDLRPGLVEMTLLELNDRIRHPPSARAESGARAHRSDRFALVASVFVFALLGLGIAGRWRSRTATMAAAIGLIVLYGGAFSVGAGMLKRAAGIGYETWLANLVFAAIGAALLASRARPLSTETAR
jgi:hypothetical protein